MNLECTLVILSALKFIGLCPIRRDNSTGRYVFLWSVTTAGITFGAVWSILVAAAAFFVHLIYFTHATLGIHFIFGPGIHYTGTATVKNLRSSSKLSEGQIEANRLCWKITMGLICAQYFFYHLASLRNRQNLPKLLNHWTNVKARIDRVTAHGERTEKTGSRVALVSGVIIGSAALVGLVPTLTFIATAPNHSDLVLEIAISTVICMYMGLGEVLHDATMVLMCKELRNNFIQAQKVLRNVRIQEAKAEKHNDEASMDAWCQLVLEIRKQGALLSEYLAAAQLTSLFQTLAVITLTVFSILTAWASAWVHSGGKPEYGFMVMTNLLGVVFLLTRLYFKLSAAQDITNAEASLATQVMAEHFYSDSLTEDPNEKAKLLDLVHLVRQKPCEVNLGDLVTLRRNLFLSVLGQIATYLIVITQFYDSK